MIKEFFSSIFGSNKKENTKAWTKSAGIELIQYIENEYNKFKTHFDVQRENEEEAWNIYSGFEYGQWDAENASQLLDEDRHVPQFNFIRKKINGLAGSFLKNWYDVDFLPVDGRYSPLTVILKQLYYSDKEMMDWAQSYAQFVIDYLVHSGTEQMVISQRYSPLGNIGFERVLPGHILYDPDWVDNNGWNCKKAFKVAYYDANQMAELFDEKSEEIRVAQQLIDNNGKMYDAGNLDDGQTPHKDLDNIYGSNHKVIEAHIIKSEKEKIEIVVNKFGDVMQVPQEYNDEEKRQWAIVNEVDFSVGVTEHEVPIDKYYVTTICPDFRLVLQDKTDAIQIGRLPFFKASCARINGRDSGMVELLKDVQQTVNKRESLIDDIISNSAGGGMIIDPEVFGNDMTKMQNVKKNWNNPRFKEFSKPGEIASGRKHIEELPRSQWPADAANQLQRMWDLADRLSNQPAVTEGRSEGSEDRSGVLNARKQQQVEISNTYELLGLEGHWNAKGEAYMLLAKSLYAGVYREFKTPGKNESFAINEDVPMSNGTQKINDIGSLPRHKVIVSQSPQGVTYREIERSINAELLSVLPQQNPISRAQVVENIMKSLDNSNEQKMELAETAKIEKQLAMESTLTQIESLKAQRVQMQAQTQQAMMMMQNPQMAMQAAVEEGGAPAEQPTPAEAQPVTPIG